MRLDKRFEPPAAGRGKQFPERRRLQGPDNEQDGGGARGARLGHLELVQDEVLPDEREGHGLPHRFQVGDRSAEVLPLGQDRERGGTGRRVRRGASRRVQFRGDEPGGGGAALQFGNDRHLRPAQRRPEVGRRGPATCRLLQDVPPGGQGRQSGPDTFENTVERGSHLDLRFVFG